jgi:hypothetical protein
MIVVFVVRSYCFSITKVTIHIGDMDAITQCAANAESVDLAALRQALTVFRQRQLPRGYSVNFDSFIVCPSCTQMDTL